MATKSLLIMNKYASYKGHTMSTPVIFKKKILTLETRLNSSNLCSGNLSLECNCLWSVPRVQVTAIANEARKSGQRSGVLRGPVRPTLPGLVPSQQHQGLPTTCTMALHSPCANCTTLSAHPLLCLFCKYGRPSEIGPEPWVF